MQLVSLRSHPSRLDVLWHVMTLAFFIFTKNNQKIPFLHAPMVLKDVLIAGAKKDSLSQREVLIKSKIVSRCDEKGPLGSCHHSKWSHAHVSPLKVLINLRFVPRGDGKGPARSAGRK